MEKVVLLYLGRRGAGPEYALEMAKALSKYVKVLCVLSKYISNIRHWKQAAQNIANLTLLEVHTYRSASEFFFSSFNFFRYWFVVRSINKFNPDFIYSPMTHFWECFIVPFCKCNNTIQTVHDVILHEGENGIEHKLLSYIFRYKSSKYVILSSAFRPQMRNRGISDEQILVIPHAVFKGYYHGPLKEDFYQYNRFLFFGRIIKYKGIEVLLASMKTVINRMPKVRLFIAGNGDIEPYRELLYECSENIDLKNDWIEDCEVEGLFRDIDFVVVPYTHASQSGVIPLSYSFGKPVIATKIGGLPEQVCEGKTGLLIEAGSEEQLSNAILELFLHADKLKAMKKACYEYAFNNTWDSSAIILIDAFK